MMAKLLTLLLLLTTGCTITIPAALPDLPPNLLPVTVEQSPFQAPAAPCTDTFVPHLLDHTTTVEGQVVRLFDSNGSGLAINDLDNDGDLDLVLANLAGPNAIFWNEGNLVFRKEPLSHGDSRAVAIVDVDGDNWLDIIFTRRLTPPTYWRNNLATTEMLAGEPSFIEGFLPGVAKYAYSMAWADLDKDGDLDLVTGSYNLALQMALGEAFRASTRAGAFYYERQDDRFVSHYLTGRTQALALILFDLNQDGWQDILLGNDFDRPDQAWLYEPDGWQATTPFTNTTQNTMSFAVGDINNDGWFDLFAADMKPYHNDPETLAAWKPVMDRVPHHLPPGDPQILENVLQLGSPTPSFENHAVGQGVSATGWSWSAKFGDLDHDGFLDLYVVNGMTALDLFSHLPNEALVEENLVFRNAGGHGFVSIPTWGLNSLAGGRSMSMADLDQDGDLDIVVNNLLSPAQLFENRLCGGDSLEIDLQWPPSQNTRALGAQLILHTTTGTYYRTVQATSGYLSGDPTRVHFGLPKQHEPVRLTVRWPDDQISVIDQLMPGRLVIIRRE